MTEPGDPPPGPLTDAARIATLLPDVIADPDQVEDRGVWTRIEDVMPGTWIPNGAHVVACWGSITWTARAQWDEHDADLLWLIPVDAPRPGPSAHAAYPAGLLAHRILASVGSSPVGVTGHVTLDPGQLERVLHTLLATVWDDVDSAFGTLLDALTRDRRIAQDILVQARELAPAPRDRLLETPAGWLLQRVARRAWGRRRARLHRDLPGG